LFLALLPALLAVTVARADDVWVNVDNAGGGCGVRGGFLVPVSDSLAWNVLTDYDHIVSFVSSMRSSRIVSRDSSGLKVHQVAVGGVFIFHKRVEVVLHVREEPFQRIAFRDELRKDFKDYQGEWRVTSGPSGTVVEYELAAEPRAALPRSVCRGALGHTAHDLLEQVRAEMLRRAPCCRHGTEDCCGRDRHDD
jgi:hypothetical protein